MNILVTGANGFVGRALCPALKARGHEVRCAVRAASAPDQWTVGEIGPTTDWRGTLQGIEVVVHLAARVHVMQERSADPWAEFRRVNVEGTRRLALEASQYGVRRLIYISSVKVNGEATVTRGFTASDRPAPQDAYGLSKWEAEQALAEVAATTGLEGVILRPPLIHGPGVGANFARLVSWVRRRLPLPLGAVDNRRSLLGLENFVDAIGCVVSHPMAAGKTYLLSDGEVVSTPQLIRMLGRLMACPPRLFSVPLPWLRLMARTAGWDKEISRLVDSLVVDDSAFRDELKWIPPLTLEQGLAQVVRS